MYRVLSLFSGCGGLDLGLEGGFTNVADGEFLPRNNLDTVFANDIRPGAKLAWENYFNKQGVYHLESIVDLVNKARQGEFSFPEADIVTGGFPCQDFSVAGKRLGFNSSVSHDGQTAIEIENGSYEAASVENRGQLYMNFESDGKFLGTYKKYEEFRLLSTEEKNQILREYFTAHRAGENKWYIPISSSISSEDGDVSVGVTLFSSLAITQKNKLIAEAFILYLNHLFKYPVAEYSSVAKYYAEEYFVADSSLRDKFTASGKIEIFNDGNRYPRIYQTFKAHIDDIKDALRNPTAEFIEKCYETWINEQDYAGIQFNEMDPIDVSFNKIITNYKPYPKVAARNGYEAQQQFDLSRLYRLHK